eukprot:PRCOL_00005924-RA
MSTSIVLRREVFDAGLVPLEHAVRDGARRRALREGGAGALAPVRDALLRRGVGPAPLAEALGTSASNAAALIELCKGVAPRAENGTEAELDAHAVVLFLFAQTYHRPQTHAAAAAAANSEHWPGGADGGSSTGSGAGTMGVANMAVDSRGGIERSASPIGGGPGSPRSPRSPRKAVADYGVSAAEERRQHAAFVRHHVGGLLRLCVDAPRPQAGTAVSARELDRLSMLLVPAASPSLALSRLAPALFGAPGNAAGGGDIPQHATTTVGAAAIWLVERIVSPGEGLGGAPVSPMQMASPTPASEAQAQAIAHRELGRATRVEGVHRATAVRTEADIAAPGDLVVTECAEGVVYALAPLRRAIVSSCRDGVAVLGAVGAVARIERCERMQVLLCCKRVVVSNCHDCTLFLATNTPPILVGDNRNVLVAPYNTFYPSLRAHLAAARIDPTVNCWDTIALLEEEDELVRPTVHGGAGAAPAAVHAMPPERFVPFIVPIVESGTAASAAAAASQPHQADATQTNPFSLPPEYAAALEAKVRSVAQLRAAVKEASLSDERRRELQSVIQSHFKDWLLHSGNMRQVFDLARAENGEGR